MPIGRAMYAAFPGIMLSIAVAAAAPAQHRLLTTRTSHHLRLSGYQTLSAAKIGCGSGAVVWRAPNSKVFHTAQSHAFGRTRHGMYVCRRSALADHLTPAKN